MNLGSNHQSGSGNFGVVLLFGIILARARALVDEEPDGGVSAGFSIGKNKTGPDLTLHCLRFLRRGRRRRRCHCLVPAERIGNPALVAGRPAIGGRAGGRANRRPRP